MDTKKRSIVKALSWRITATVTTILIVLLFTGKLLLALSVGLVELVVKLLLYYVHERAWNRLRWGRKST